MTEADPLALNAVQISKLEKFLKAGFKFVTLEHVARYLAMEKEGFVALLDPSDGKIAVFGQVGYRMGNGIGMLVERREGKAFVWKSESVSASPDLLDAYAKIRAELDALLAREGGEGLGNREQGMGNSE